MNDEILIKDIYWDRIYLNIELTGKIWTIKCS